MTIEEKVRQNLYERGMFEDQAQAVIDQIKAKTPPLMEAHVWRDKVDVYPPIMFVALWMNVEHEALKWIDANCPDAFFRSLFVHNHA